VAKEGFIIGKQDACHHDGLRSTRRRLDAAVAEMQRGRENAHEPVARYFSLWHGEHQLYSTMKPCQPAVDALVKDNTLIAQLRLDGEIEIYKADTTIKEPIELET
jgi:hypothetical protein